tara:strand:+ start:6743 stop:7633 length:891 start_codon:yes stop_codon:yes gene_type:complete
MNKTLACQILEIDPENINEDIIKRQYRAFALLYHPDKSKNKNSKELFQKVNEANKYLLTHCMNHEYVFEDERNLGYSKFVFKFFNQLFQGYQQQELWISILEKISTSCKYQVLTYLHTLDKTHLIKTYEILHKYRNNLHLEAYIFEMIKTVIKEKVNLNEKIILNPNIDDLYEHNVYKLTIRDNDFFVPLWHSYLTYDISGNELEIECIPELPKHICIDSNNNVHIDYKVKKDSLLEDFQLIITFGDQNIRIDGQHIRFQEKQTILQKYSGIPIPNKSNPYDVTNISDLYVHLTIT